VAPPRTQVCPGAWGDQIDLNQDREIEVLRFIAQGRDNDSIAAAMHLSVRTVERHLSNSYAKLGVGGKVGAGSGRGPARDPGTVVVG
jgi:DNA-binding NarL/FixJ family response regulator